MLELMKEMQEQLDEIEKKLSAMDEERAELEKKRDAIKQTVDFGKKVADYYEEKLKEEADYRAEAVAQLYVSQRTDADLKTFCEQTNTALPDSLETAAEEDTEEIKAALA